MKHFIFTFLCFVLHHTSTNAQDTRIFTGGSSSGIALVYNAARASVWYVLPMDGAKIVLQYDFVY